MSIMASRVQGRDLAAVKDLEAQPVRTDSKRTISTWDRVKNVVWIKETTVYNKALEDRDREIKVTGECLVRREKRSDELSNEIYNVVGFFSVFQGVILTAVSQLAQSSSSATQSAGCTCSRPLCGKVWFPIVLSGLAAVAAVIGIGLKFRDIHRVEVLIIKEKREQSAVIERENALRQQGEKSRSKSWKDPPQSGSLKSHSLVKAAGVIGPVLVFTGVFILSYLVILCDKWVIEGWD